MTQTLDILPAEEDVSPSPAPTASQRERWIVACHEAAHATVAAALGFLPRTAAVVCDAGWTSFQRDKHDCCPSTMKMATIAIAGGLGERLAAAVNPPARERRRIGIEATMAKHAAELDAIEADAGDVDAGPDDTEFVARHVTLTSDWGLWTARARHVHDLAQHLLDEHAALHRGIAEALYHAGFLGQAELENLVRDHAPLLWEDSSNDDLR